MVADLRGVMGVAVQKGEQEPTAAADSCSMALVGWAAGPDLETASPGFGSRSGAQDPSAGGGAVPFSAVWGIPRYLSLINSYSGHRVRC